MELTEKPEKFAVLKELNESLGIPLKFLHVIRNPFDVISTWVLRLLNARLKANDGITKVQCAVEDSILILTSRRIKLFSDQSNNFPLANLNKCPRISLFRIIVQVIIEMRAL